MCIVIDGRDIVSLPVEFRQPVWQTMTPHGRRNFVFYLPNIRNNVSIWLASLKGGIPLPVYSTLMNSEWEDFSIPSHGLRLGVFMIILYFFEVNQAPVELRRQFWCWIMPRPLFNDGSMADPSHPYIQVFFDMCKLDPFLMFSCGAFHDVNGSRQMAYNGTVWRAYNIWGCNGFGLPIPQIRHVDTVFRLIDGNGNILSWRGRLAPETVATGTEETEGGNDDASTDSDTVASFDTIDTIVL